MSEYQCKPILRVSTVDAHNPDISWHWVSFGRNKARAIMKHFEAIKKFAEKQEERWFTASPEKLRARRHRPAQLEIPALYP